MQYMQNNFKSYFKWELSKLKKLITKLKGITMASEHKAPEFEPPAACVGKNNNLNRWEY